MRSRFIQFTQVNSNPSPRWYWSKVPFWYSEDIQRRRTSSKRNWIFRSKLFQLFYFVFLKRWNICMKYNIRGSVSLLVSFWIAWRQKSMCPKYIIFVFFFKYTHKFSFSTPFQPCMNNWQNVLLSIVFLKKVKFEEIL